MHSMSWHVINCIKVRWLKPIQKMPNGKKCFRIFSRKKRNVERSKVWKMQRLARESFFISRLGKVIDEQRLARKSFFVSRLGKGIEEQHLARESFFVSRLGKGMEEQRLAWESFFVSRLGKGMEKQRLARKSFFVSRLGKGKKEQRLAHKSFFTSRSNKVKKDQHLAWKASPFLGRAKLSIGQRLARKDSFVSKWVRYVTLILQYWTKKKKKKRGVYIFAPLLTLKNKQKGAIVDTHFTSSPFGFNFTSSPLIIIWPVLPQKPTLPSMHSFTQGTHTSHEPLSCLFHHTLEPNNIPRFVLTIGSSLNLQ